MKEHNFNKSLLYEKEGFEFQDSIYKKLNPSIIEIQRTEYEEDEGRENQRKDIDLFFFMNDGKKFKISEKRREKDYGDILFEVLHVGKESKKRRLGWIHNEESDAIIYWIDNQNFFWQIQTNQKFKRIFGKEIYPNLRPRFMKFIDNGKNFEKTIIRVNNEEIAIGLTCAENEKCKYKEGYYSYGITIKPKDLEKLGVVVKKIFY